MNSLRKLVFQWWNILPSIILPSISHNRSRHAHSMQMKKEMEMEMRMGVRMTIV